MSRTIYSPDDFPSDSVSLRLSHPRRIRAFMGANLDITKQLLGPEWPILEAALKSSTFQLASIDLFIEEKKLYRLRQYLEITNQHVSATELGGAISFLLSLRASLMSLPHFLVDDTLLDMLVQTDISDDITVGSIKLPYPKMYLELGLRRELKETIPNPQTGDHILEGAYLEEGFHIERGKGLYIVLTGSGKGKSSCMDDATHATFISQSNPEQTLSASLQEALDFAKKAALQAGLNPPEENSAQDIFRAILLLAKSLLYISLPEARRTNVLEYSQGLKDAERLKNPAKKAKAIGKASKLVDYIVIQPAAEHEKVFSQGNSAPGQRKVHWRRGHYRMQRHGAGLKDSKLVFIAPTLVGADGGAGDSAPKDYVVR